MREAGLASQGLVNWGGDPVNADVIERITDVVIDPVTGQIELIDHDQPMLEARITAYGRLVHAGEGGIGPMMAEYCLEMHFNEPWNYNPYHTYEPIAGFGGQTAYCAIAHLSPSLIPTLPTDIQLLGYKDGSFSPVLFTVEEEVLLLIPIEEMLGLERLRMLYRAPPFVPEFHPGSDKSPVLGFVCL